MDFNSPNLNEGVRIFHAAVNEKVVDVYINDERKIQSLQYSQASTYLPLRRGRYNFKIYSSSNGNLLYNETVNIEGSKFITLSTVAEKGKVSMVVFQDRFPTRNYYSSFRNEIFTPQGNTVKTVIDQYSNVVEVITSRTGVIYNDIKDQFGNVIFQAGNKIVPIIDKLGNLLEVVIDNAGKVVGVVIDYLGGITLGIIVRIGDTIKQVADQFGNMVEIVVDEFENLVGWVLNELGVEGRITGQTNMPMVRFAHLSENTPSVDVVISPNIKLFNDTMYKQITNYIPIGTGTYTISFRLKGTKETILSMTNVSLNPREYYTIYLIGIRNGNPSLEAVILRDGI